MNKLLILLSLAFGMIQGLQAQTKMDIGLNHIIQTQKIGKTVIPGSKAKSGDLKLQSVSKADDNQIICVIAKLKPGSGIPETSLQNLGITIDFHEGNFAVLSVPVRSLSSLEDLTEFVSFEENRVFKLDNKISHEATHVTDIQDAEKAAQEGLSQTYTGKGVVVGVFDKGIDFNHNNFRDPTTRETRIKKAIIYSGNVTNFYPSVYTNSADIDKLTTDDASGSHGTHTSSTIAGSYSGNYVNENGKITYSGLQGAAPEADLVLAGTSTLSSANQMHALNEMDKTAEKLGEPLVVNLSLGGHSWMDGKDAMCQFFDEFTDHGNKPGRIVCISAGNEADTKSSIKTTLDSTNNHTVKTFIQSSFIGYYLPDISVYSRDTTSFTVQLELYNSKYELISTISSADLVDNGFLTYGHFANHDGRFAAELYIDALSFDEDSIAHCAITVTNNKDCEIELYGQDVLGSSINLSSDSLQCFTDGTTDQSINYLCCTNSVLSVGAYTANNTWNSLNGNAYYTSHGKYGDIADFSSYTSADDNGVQRPDFCSPGVAVISGYNSNDSITYKVSEKYICGKASENYLEGHTSFIGSMTGTSMACPNATGIIALWLQKNPNLTVNEIREIIQETADKDDFTNAKPIMFGSGKINALAGIKNFEEQKVFYNESYDLDGNGKLDATDVARLVNYILGRKQ